MPAEVFGGLTLPIAAPEDAKAAITDPLLAHSLEFWRAVANYHCNEVWRCVSPDRPQPVMATFAHNPADAEFNERDLPALFAWRERVDRRYSVAEDYRVEQGVIALLWIPHPVVQAKIARRHSFPNGLFKALDFATTRDMDISWRDGEVTLSSTAGFRRLWPMGSRPQVATIELDGSEPRRYTAWEMSFQYEEQWVATPVFEPVLAQIETIIR